MPQDLSPAEPSRSPEAEPQKRSYRRPELRDLGALAEITQTVGGPPGNADSAANYANS
jgi:hypothetical protein